MTRDEARRRFAAAGIADPATDARRLWDHANTNANTAEDVAALFRKSVEDRLTRKPVSRIIGGRHFWKGWFLVTPDVLDPRPDTESLIEVALQEDFSRVLDLGTGSGCIVISLLTERPDATAVGTDISENAVLVAGRNAVAHDVSERLILPLSDWYDDIGGRFDLIVSNPPYIAASEMNDLEPEVKDHEPRMALTDEADGLSAYRIIAKGALDHLTSDGRLIVEIGATQGEAVTRIFREAGLERVTMHKDLSGRDRVVQGYKMPL